MEVPPRRRVKVYQMNDSGEWDDKGTGQVFIVFESGGGYVCLDVKSEDDGSTIIHSKVPPGQSFTSESLILWSDPDTGFDLAVSFQERVGCREIWQQLIAIQSKMEHSDETVLPPPTEENIVQIFDIITDVSTQIQKDKVVINLLREDYLHKLLNLFDIFEEKENHTNLYLLFGIFKTLILMNENLIFDVIFADEFLTKLMGVFEYDPDLKRKQNHRKYLQQKNLFKEVIEITNPDILSKIHQTFKLQYLKDVVLPRILDDSTFASINSFILFNQIEIVVYIQNTTPLLKSLFNKFYTGSPSDRKHVVLFLFELCTLSKNLANIRPQFFNVLTEHGLWELCEQTITETDFQTRISIVEIMTAGVGHDVSLLRHYMLTQRPKGEMFRVLLRQFLAERETGIKVHLMEIVKSLLDNNNETPPTSLESDPPAPSPANTEEKKEFFNLFYEGGIVQLLLLPFTHKNTLSLTNNNQNSLDTNSNTNELDDTPNLSFEKEENIPNGGETQGENHEGVSSEHPSEYDPSNNNNNGIGSFYKSTEEFFEKNQDSDTLESSQYYVCELFAFCMNNHDYRIKYFIIRNNVIAKVFKLLRSSQTYLILGAIRFFRNVIGRKDVFYLRHIMKYHLFDPIIQIFRQNGEYYNLVNSAIIEIFDYIKKEGLTDVITYLVERYETFFKTVKYVDTFSMLLTKHEQHQEYLQSLKEETPANSTSALEKKRLDSRKRPLDDDDEDYFRESDDEDNETSTQPPKTKPKLLVPYNEDDDDDDDQSNKSEQDRSSSAPSSSTTSASDSSSSLSNSNSNSNSNNNTDFNEENNHSSSHSPVQQNNGSTQSENGSNSEKSTELSSKERKRPLGDAESSPQKKVKL